jgi:hypothetical protein
MFEPMRTVTLLLRITWGCAALLFGLTATPTGKGATTATGVVAIALHQTVGPRGQRLCRATSRRWASATVRRSASRADRPALLDSAGFGLAHAHDQVTSLDVPFRLMVERPPVVIGMPIARLRFGVRHARAPPAQINVHIA